MKPLISVILPIYNMELYLERCLDSILGSSYHNLEIICVDDGSKDGSLEILRRYEAADPRVIVIAKENGGVSSARNAGLDRMTGAFVSFIDPDDFIHPRYFELLFRTLTEANADISICGFRRVEDKDLPLAERVIHGFVFKPLRSAFLPCIIDFTGKTKDDILRFPICVGYDVLKLKGGKLQA